MASTVGSATVKSAASAGSVTVKSTAAMEFTASARCYAMEAGVAVESTVKSARIAIAERRAATEDRSRVEAAAIEAVEPWTRADKYAAGKIIRAIVAVRSARVWSEPVVAIRADRSRTNVYRSHLNRKLRVSTTRRNNKNRYQSQVF